MLNRLNFRQFILTNNEDCEDEKRRFSIIKNQNFSANIFRISICIFPAGHQQH